MMRFTYPRSFLSLLVIGFTIVAAPLLFALFSNALAFERLAGMSEQAVHSAVKVTQASRSLVTTVNSLERSARQYAVAGEATFLEAYQGHREAFVALLRQLDTMTLSEEQRAEVGSIEQDANAIDAYLSRTGPTPVLAQYLQREFGALTDRAHRLVALGDHVIDESIEQLRTQAVQSRNSVFWLMMALIPTAVLLIASFTYLIARPITQVSAGIKGLGEGDFGKPIQIEGPGDMVRLGEQLDWLRERLITLESQKTRFLQHVSHELKTPLTALREGSDLLSSGVVGTLNAEQREIARILKENSIELRKLIEALLNYSAVHAQTHYLDARIVPLKDLVMRVINDRTLAIVYLSNDAYVRLYDALWIEGDDLRTLRFDERRARLEAWMALKPRPRFDLSPLVQFTDWAHLAQLREEMRSDGIEGLMLKRADSPYLAGRPKGPWFKWKRDPHLVDCVLMYAQRGHGKRSSFYSDFTFGCWREAPSEQGGKRELAPVGKAYFGFTDEELRWLDRWVRSHTVQRFGPVREV